LNTRWPQMVAIGALAAAICGKPRGPGLDGQLEKISQQFKNLMARRSELGPTDPGLPKAEPGTRRVSGLRREEVAAHTAISHDYYTRIEQGRIGPSDDVLDALATTLRLTPAERAYAEGLAQQVDKRTIPRRKPPAARPQIQRLLDQLTASQDFGRKTIHHPELGEFTFDWDSYYWTGDPDRHVTVWSPAPDCPSEEKLRTVLIECDLIQIGVAARLEAAR
jgi:transcriptional regulator with XRE-family HTH domain